MAYCRWSRECRVYMYSSITGGYQFHLSGGVVDGQSDFNIKDPHEALRKLKRLQTQGFGVPQYAIDRLASEVHPDEDKPC
jgi:hypothetical protein